MTTFWVKSKRSGTGSVTTSGSDSVVSVGERSDGSVTTGGAVHLSKRVKRLVTFNADLLARLLKAVVARRDADRLVQIRGWLSEIQKSKDPEMTSILIICESKTFDSKIA